MSSEWTVVDENIPRHEKLLLYIAPLNKYAMILVTKDESHIWGDLHDQFREHIREWVENKSVYYRRIPKCKY